jgi:hypothetical protein
MLILLGPGHIRELPGGKGAGRAAGRGAGGGGGGGGVGGAVNLIGSGNYSGTKF